jgi:hypothetical protein
MIIAACVVRFVALDSAPPGFYVDEAAGAANTMCLQQQGIGELGDPYPIFFPAFSKNSGAFHTAPYVYSQAVWTKFAGTSPAGFRSFIAFISVLTIVGIFFLTSIIATPTAAWYAALAAGISPWLFQFSRIAWDPPLDPFFLVWALVFFFRSSKLRDATVCGILLALAAYAYPPARAQIPLLFPALLFAKFKLQPATVSKHSKFIAVTLLTSLVTAIPLLQKTFSGEIQARAKMLSVFSPAYLINTYGSPSPIGGLKAFLANFARHLDPNFLFISGDHNLRHSTGYTGILSALDALAILAILFLIIKKQIPKTPVLIATAGFATGIAASSLTWEGIPHALRAIGAAPFVAIFTGIVLANASQHVRHMRSIAMSAAALFFTYFCWAYFTQYAPKAGPWFDQQVTIAAHAMHATSNRDSFVSTYANYPQTGLHYHLMQTFHEPCINTSTLDQSR